jgi:hypothetical protein
MGVHCHAYECLYTALGLVVVFIEHLRSQTQVSIALLLIHAPCRSLQHVLSLHGALCLHQLSGDGSQQCTLLPCSRFYRLATVSELTDCSHSDPQPSSHITNLLLSRLSEVRSESKLYYYRRSVGQSILVSGTHLGAR